MLNQTFSPIQLRNNTFLKDIIKYQLGRDREAITKSLTKISYKITDENFDFKHISKTTVSGDSVYMATDVAEYYALKQIDYVLRKIYNVTFSNKSTITNQICKILSDNYKYEIIRLDIRKFFENINREKTIKKITEDSFLSSQMIDKLNKFNHYLETQGEKGLPRGISLSSTLSEIYIRKLDKKIIENMDVYFYARYVDDIIVICNENSTGLKKIISSELKRLKLEPNEKSTFVFMGKEETTSISYLGLKYTFKKSSKKVEISLSEKKIKKIKSRIIKAILDCYKNKNYNLLEMRINFLTGNHFLYKDGVVTKLKSGIYYSNQNINIFRDLNNLNTFLRKSITSKKGNFGKKASAIPYKIREGILKKCFFSGFINKTMHSFSNKDFLKIKDCWKNE